MALKLPPLMKTGHLELTLSAESGIKRQQLINLKLKNFVDLRVTFKLREKK